MFFHIVYRKYSYLVYFSIAPSNCSVRIKSFPSSFKKAIDIEPENESYHSNLKLAEEKMASSGSPGAGILGKAYIRHFLVEYSLF